VRVLPSHPESARFPPECAAARCIAGYPEKIRARRGRRCDEFCAINRGA
jgi:hypothetical protein